jgi:O-methyltransferase
MNVIKLITPDFFVGKSLVMLKTTVDLILMVAKQPSWRSLKLAQLIFTVKPNFTMVKTNNLVNLYNLVQKVNSRSTIGDIVECGVWNGGSAAIMASACASSQGGIDRRIWLFDSFAGLPTPGPRDGAMERKYYFQGMNKGSVEEVKRVFGKLSLPMENIKICAGWFSATLPAADIQRIAILHIDADWYSSVMAVLETMYDKVVPGGFVVLDDYGYWDGCTQAIENFIREHKIDGVKLERVASTGAYFQKPNCSLD